MALPNSKIAETFEEIADLLELEGENPFRVRAYRNAARVVASHPANLAEAVLRGKLPRLPGIGQDLSAKIHELAEKRELSMLRDMEKRVTPALREMLKIPSLGPKRIRVLEREGGIRTLEELRKAAMAGRLRRLPGFGFKSEQRILSELARLNARPVERVLLRTAEQVADPLLRFLRATDGVRRAEIAGSYRRRVETVGDIDILVEAAPRAANRIMDCFTHFEEVQTVLSQGEKRSTVRLFSGLQVDVRIISPRSYGAALLYFTGSKAHNIELRNQALRKGLRINEYGVFRDEGRKGVKRIAGAAEEEIYRIMGMDWIPPELRENRGELAAALQGELPSLLNLGDLRGDLHAHTTESDGHASLEEMAREARDLGYEYLAITEHSQRLGVARGLSPDRLQAHLRAIDALNEKLAAEPGREFRLLKAAEVDILENGTLDYPDRLLRRLDLTVCSVHSAFNLSRQKQTDRILRAMDNPYFRILGHPTGRLIGQRDPYDFDFEKVLRAARERGRILELDSQPSRLDLNDVLVKAAKQAGVLISISSDSHQLRDLSNIRFGVGQARRGWLEKRDVVNTRGLKQLLRLLAGKSV